MHSASCEKGRAACVNLERRRSDFEHDARVTPFTGSCCCCCCLHWIGAAVGGIVGMRMGWKAAHEKIGAPLPPQASRTLSVSLYAGIFLSSALLVVAIATAGNAQNGFLTGYLVLLALVPSAAFVPIGLPMVLATYGVKVKMLSAFRRELRKLPPKDGVDKNTSLYRARLTAPPKMKGPLTQVSVFCRHCWFDLEESMHLAACPECGEAIESPVISGPDFGLSIAWRATLMSLAVGSAGMVIGYGLMLLISLLT